MYLRLVVLPPRPVPEYQTWNRPQDPTIAWKAEAETELLVALRDGDLLAQGRFTEERTHLCRRDVTADGRTPVRAMQPLLDPLLNGTTRSLSHHTINAGCRIEG